MYWTLLSRIVKLIGFEILRSIHGAVQSITWRLNGIRHDVQNAKQPESYSRCAQVLDIHSYFSFETLVFTSKRNFICSHNRFENPRYVFENEHVTLLTINDEYAMFVEASSKEMHLWKMEYSGFIKLAQLQYCNKLILIPVEHFHRMAEELGDPKQPIIFLFNVGRCGSTLVTQMMENTGRCISISEPAPLLYIFNKLMDGMEKAEKLRTSCRDIVRWVCRPCPSCKPLAYFVKVDHTFSSILPVVFEAFPTSKYLFMYRNVADVSQSFSKVIQELPYLFLMNAAAKHSCYLRQKLLEAFDMQEMFQCSDAHWNDLFVGIVMFTKYCQLYSECRGNDLPISAIRYEDLISDPDYAIRKIFNYCQLPDYLIGAAREGLKDDSQRNSPLSMSNLRKHRPSIFDERTKRFANTLLNQFNLALIGEDCLLEGTITSKK